MKKELGLVGRDRRWKCSICAVTTKSILFTCFSTVSSSLSLVWSNTQTQILTMSLLKHCLCDYFLLLSLLHCATKTTTTTRNGCIYIWQPRWWLVMLPTNIVHIVWWCSTWCSVVSISGTIFIVCWQEHWHSPLFISLVSLGFMLLFVHIVVCCAIGRTTQRLYFLFDTFASLSSDGLSTQESYAHSLNSLLRQTISKVATNSGVSKVCVVTFSKNLDSSEN